MDYNSFYESFIAPRDLDKARKAVTDYLKGYNINDPEQVKEMARLKNIVKELEQE